MLLVSFRSACKLLLKFAWFDVTDQRRNPSASFPAASAEIASEGLKGRVFEVSQADLTNGEDAYRKFRLIAEEVQGRNVLTNFHGMDLTTDKLRSMVKKWQVGHARLRPPPFEAFGYPAEVAGDRQFGSG